MTNQTSKSRTIHPIVAFLGLGTAAVFVIAAIGARLTPSASVRQTQAATDSLDRSLAELEQAKADRAALASPSPPPSPAAQPVKPRGIGITNALLRDKFEHPDIGFQFEPSTEVKGQPRLMGKSPSGLAYLELIGPSSDLTSASLMVGMPNDRPDLAALNLVYLLGMVKTAFPQWQAGPDWVSSNLKEFASGKRQQAIVTYGGRQIKLTHVKEMGSIVLTVKRP